jgi:hypothetical protein
MPSYAIPSECAADAKGKGKSLSLHAHPASGSPNSLPTSTSLLLPNRLNNSGIEATDGHHMVQRLVQELEQGVGYDGATCSDELEGLLREMRLQADATGIAYPKGSSAHHAFQFGVNISQVRARSVLSRVNASC